VVLLGWWKLEEGLDGLGLIGATAFDGGLAHGRTDDETDAGDRAGGVALALAGA
jgi:hypothetical protein